MNLLRRKNHRSNRKNGRRGAAVVELAVVAPLFLLLLAGIIEFGQAFRIQHTLSNASRRGARAGIVDGVTTEQITDRVKNQCQTALGVSPEDITVDILVNGESQTDLSEAETQDEISVSVSIPFAKAGSGFFANMFSQSVLGSTCTMEHE